MTRAERLKRQAKRHRLNRRMSILTNEWKALKATFADIRLT